MPLQIGFYITDAVRYEQLIFLSLFLLFFIRSLSLPLSFLLLCFILPFHVSLELYFSISFSLFFLILRTCFSFHSACLCDLCCPHLPVWLNPPVCVMEHIAVIRMITIWPAPLPRGAESQSIIKFLHCLLCVCLLKWSDWPYFFQ